MSVQICLKKLVMYVGLAAALAWPYGFSWGADAGPVTISVPEGFDGPTRNETHGGVTVGWIKRQPVADGGTLLQISAVDVGTSLEAITPAQRVEATAHYLLEFLKGIGQRMQDFEFGEVEPTSLAGLPAARVRWTGSVDGNPTIGVMYCVLVHHSVVNLQTQDLGTEVSPAMYTAISAIEGVRVH